MAKLSKDKSEIHYDIHSGGSVGPAEGLYKQICTVIGQLNDENGKHIMDESFAWEAYCPLAHEMYQKGTGKTDATGHFTIRNIVTASMSRGPIHPQGLKITVNGDSVIWGSMDLSINHHPPSHN